MGFLGVDQTLASWFAAALRPKRSENAVTSPAITARYLPREGGDAALPSVVPTGSSPRGQGASSSMAVVSLGCVSPLSQLSVLLECAVSAMAFLPVCRRLLLPSLWLTVNLSVGSSFPVFAWSATCTSSYFTATSDLSFSPSFPPSFPLSFHLLKFPLSHCASVSLFFLFQSLLSNPRVSGTTFKQSIVALAAGACSCKYSTCKTPPRWHVWGRKSSRNGFSEHKKLSNQQCLMDFTEHK